MLIKYLDLDGGAPVVTWRGIRFEADEWTDVPEDIAGDLRTNRFFEFPIEAVAVDVTPYKATQTPFVHEPIPEAISDLDLAPAAPVAKRGRGRRA